MNKYKKYEMETQRPSIHMYTTMYYYNQGKLVGERKVVNGKTVYYELLGARREVSGADKLSFSAHEKHVDQEAQEAFNKAVNEYNTQRDDKRNEFIKTMCSEYKLNIGEVLYFCDKNDGNFGEIEDDIMDYTNYRDQY